jgi:hypothetical protein
LSETTPIYYAQKLINSGYSITQTKKIILNGIKGYEKKLLESRKPGGRSLHRQAGESYNTRVRRKLCGKTEWYRDEISLDKGLATESNANPELEYTPPSIDTQHKKKIKNDRSIKTRSVLFVEQTRGGKLMKLLKETQSRLTGMLGFKLKIEERGGTKLSMLLPNTNPWRGAPCGRADCVTCNQGGDHLPDCTRRNILYENICTVCNPDMMEKKGHTDG